MSNKIFFKAINTKDSYILIGGANTKSKATDVLKKVNNISFNDYTVKLFISNMLDIKTKSIRVFIGNLHSRNTKVIHKGTLNTENGKIYIGDIKKTSYLIIGIGNKRAVDVEISINKNSEITLVYLYLDTNNIIQIDESEDMFTVDQRTAEDVEKLGKINGCHVCGKKNGKHLAVILPPPELDISSDHRWYPICAKHHKKTKREITKLVEALL